MKPAPKATPHAVPNTTRVRDIVYTVAIILAAILGYQLSPIGTPTPALVCPPCGACPNCPEPDLLPNEVQVTK